MFAYTPKDHERNLKLIRDYFRDVIIGVCALDKPCRGWRKEGGDFVRQANLYPGNELGFI